MEFETIPTPREVRANIHWFGGPCGRWNRWEEFVRCAEWKFTGHVYEVGDLKAVLTIAGQRYRDGKRKRYRPTHWWLKLAYGRLEQEVATGRCQSIIDAQKTATQLLSTSLQAFATWVYRKCNKISVYRYVPTKPTIMNIVKVEEWLDCGPPRLRGWHDSLTREMMKQPRNWEPWFTYFEIDWDHYRVLPCGFYLFIGTDLDGKLDATIQDRSNWSWSGYGDPAITRLAERLPRWHESPGSTSHEL